MANRRGAIAGLLLTMTLVAAACGGTAQSTQQGSNGTAPKQRTTLKVGIIPISTVLPLYEAIDIGAFDKAGIDIQTTALQGGPALFAALEAGSVDVVYAGYVSLFVPVSEGFDFVVVSGNDLENAQVGPDGKPIKGLNGMVVKADSPIKTAADLKGKKVAINALNNILQVYSQNWLASEGQDPNGVQYVAVAYPEMGAALAQDRVDAANWTEPFLSIALAKGEVREIGTPFAAAAPDLQVGGWYAKRSTADQKKDVMAAFATAVRAGAKAANAATPAERAQTLGKHTGTDASSMVNARWWKYDEKGVDVAALQKEADRAKKFGLLTKDVNVNSIVIDAAKAK